MPNVFISYSRKDKEFAERLANALEADGRDVWIDYEDIPFASEWWEEICGGIESSEAAIFIISPDSLESKVCGLEVNYAIKNNKRLIPILYREAKDRSNVPTEISHLNWIYFNTPDIFDQSYRKLLETVDTDLESLRQQTRLLVRAKDWEKKGHSPSLLLRGDDLADLSSMLENPALTELQRDFLMMSIERDRQAQMLMRFVFGFIGGFLGIGFWAFSTFRSDILITPLRLIYTMALGQVFGLFIGLQSVLAGEMWLLTEQRLSRPVRLFLRIGGCFLLGVLAWASYIWFLESLDLSAPAWNALIFGGLGLAAGFIIRILFNVPGWLTAILTAVLTWLPIYITFQDAFSGGTTFLPLIFFYDDPNQAFSVAIPMVIFIALGADAQALMEEARALYRRFRPAKTLAAVATGSG
ncbi:MAG: toll/interleukin-1 receptor domain-containing protein [Anaerolineae bacterium]|nr:toll/interleukin-1 receptor domain-containing protein [Anaerolineae bacterium]